MKEIVKTYYSIGEAAKYLGVTIQTLRNWDKKGILKPDAITKGKARRYRIAELDRIKTPRMRIEDKSNYVTIAYARVSSHEQIGDLKRQAELLELYCAKQGYTYEIIQDIGSGMNYYKKGLKRLINLILEEKVNRLVITHKDRLLRFGSELIFSICEIKGIEVVILNQGEEISFEEELTKDVLEIITVFSARLYGSRSKKNKKLIEGMKEIVDENISKDKNISK